ncbi:hypothetical protein NPIL_501381 [Nephila pilipes]|uniref:Uncharacterized protein n=1 Tax=Nephila pilipes TaxID=299642 RepID=A0A8X6U8Z9_NEPPI|nr:hypothetical protein NPIL_501381 [Nephila pilipes]
MESSIINRGVWLRTVHIWIQSCRVTLLLWCAISIVTENLWHGGLSHGKNIKPWRHDAKPSVSLILPRFALRITLRINFTVCSPLLFRVSAGVSGHLTTYNHFVLLKAQ